MFPWGNILPVLFICCYLLPDDIAAGIAYQRSGITGSSTAAAGGVGADGLIGKGTGCCLDIYNSGYEAAVKIQTVGIHHDLTIWCINQGTHLDRLIRFCGSDM